MVIESQGKIIEAFHFYLSLGNARKDLCIMLFTIKLLVSCTILITDSSLFIDFLKAFDLVCHDIRLAKLYKYGVHGDLLNWCRHYLTDEQRVVVKGEASDWLTVTSGVSQGSLLGPLFFIIYINDLPGVISKNSPIALYADDSKMYRVINA